jgi:hypothetical protein
MMDRGDGMFWLFVSKPRSVSYRRRCWALGGVRDWLRGSISGETLFWVLLLGS